MCYTDCPESTRDPTSRGTTQNASPKASLIQASLVRRGANRCTGSGASRASQPSMRQENNPREGMAHRRPKIGSAWPTQGLWVSRIRERSTGEKTEEQGNSGQGRWEAEEGKGWEGAPGLGAGAAAHSSLSASVSTAPLAPGCQTGPG